MGSLFSFFLGKAIPYIFDTGAFNLPLSVRINGVFTVLKSILGG